MKRICAIWFFLDMLSSKIVYLSILPIILFFYLPNVSLLVITIAYWTSCSLIFLTDVCTVKFDSYLIFTQASATASWFMWFWKVSMILQVNFFQGLIWKRNGCQTEKACVCERGLGLTITILNFWYICGSSFIFCFPNPSHVVQDPSFAKWIPEELETESKLHCLERCGLQLKKFDSTSENCE